MPIGGLVVSFTSDPACRGSAREAIDADPRLERGPEHGDRMAVVVETATLAEGRDLCEALCLHPGISDVQLAYLSDEDER